MTRAGARARACVCVCAASRPRGLLRLTRTGSHPWIGEIEPQSRSILQTCVPNDYRAAAGAVPNRGGGWASVPALSAEATAARPTSRARVSCEVHGSCTRRAPVPREQVEILKFPFVGFLKKPAIAAGTRCARRARRAHRFVRVEARPVRAPDDVSRNTWSNTRYNSLQGGRCARRRAARQRPRLRRGFTGIVWTKRSQHSARRASTPARGKSGRWGSNPQQPAWKAGTLPIELRPHDAEFFRGTISRRPGRFQRLALSYRAAGVARTGAAHEKSNRGGAPRTPLCPGVEGAAPASGARGAGFVAGSLMEVAHDACPSNHVGISRDARHRLRVPLRLRK